MWAGGLSKHFATDVTKTLPVPFTLTSHDSGPESVIAKF